MTSLRFQQVSERVATGLKTNFQRINGKSIFFLPVLLTLVILFLSTPASAAEARYKNPKIGGYALDYCKKWGKECGKPAADAYCRKKGYRQALKYSVKKDTPPTKVISSDQVCQAPGCDRIDYVVCEAEAVFRDPKVGKYSLDFCQQWGKGCGKPAADAFCRYRGYGRSVDFAVRPDRPPTKVIGTGQICKEPFCDRIVLVTCRDRKGGKKGGKTAGGGGARGKADDAGDAMTVGGDDGGIEKEEGGDALPVSDYEDEYGLFEE
jgi:hypothetical protein